MDDYIEIPVYDNILLKDEPAKRPKFNRAKEKIKTQKFIEEEIEEWNREWTDAEITTILCIEV